MMCGYSEEDQGIAKSDETFVSVMRENMCWPIDVWCDLGCLLDALFSLVIMPRTLFSENAE